MSHFEFVIPLQRDELRNSAAGEYKVEKVVPHENLEEEVESKLNIQQSVLIDNCFPFSSEIG